MFRIESKKGHQAHPLKEESRKGNYSKGLKHRATDSESVLIKEESRKEGRKHEKKLETSNHRLSASTCQGESEMEA